jgi:hypothetical protein
MRALAQCRGTMMIEARKLSRYIGFILRVMARVRVHILVGFVLGAGFCKNRDKQLTHIVRVIVICNLLIQRCLTRVILDLNQVLLLIFFIFWSFPYISFAAFIF